ncbi:8351_t:CDS:2 [Rhizophagus irregularis]|nr:8351_t:CDS:2 [Rhizophagus irregularis]
MSEVPSSSSATSRPIRKACQKCRQLKIECDGNAENDVPCSNCDVGTCIYGKSSKKNYQIEKTSEILENTLSETQSNSEMVHINLNEKEDDDYKFLKKNDYADWLELSISNEQIADYKYSEFKNETLIGKALVIPEQNDTHFDDINNNEGSNSLKEIKSIPRSNEETIDVNVDLSVGSDITMLNNIGSGSSLCSQKQVSVVQSSILSIGQNVNVIERILPNKKILDPLKLINAIINGDIIKLIKMSELLNMENIGNISKAIWKKTNKFVICKRLKNNELITNKSIKDLLYELKMHRICPRIICIFGVTLGNLI